MSEEPRKTDPAQGPESKNLIWIILILVFIGLIAGYYIIEQPEEPITQQAPENVQEELAETNMPPTPKPEINQQAGTQSDDLPAPDAVEETVEEVEEVEEAVDDTVEQAAEAVSPAGSPYAPLPDVEPVSEINVDRALSDRILGDSSAPVKVSEHSSFTCGHCADFHRETYPEFKKNYIETGEAYLVFMDFPLNAPALQASVIARCVPKENYFRFIQMLFVNQGDWAFEANYMDYLKEQAARYGLPAELFDECANNSEIQQGILAGVRAAQSAWDISSTPSFVVNNQHVITGAMDYSAFDEAIQEALAEPAPADEPVPGDSEQ